MILKLYLRILIDEYRYLNAVFKVFKEIEDSTAEHYGLHSDCFKAWFNVAETEKFTGLQRRHSSSLENPNSNSKQNNSFFHGKFKKYSGSLAGNSYILKMRQDDAPELPEVEYLCNQIGRELNTPVAEFYYIDFYGDKTFVTKNFIKQDSPIDLQHIYHFRSDEIIVVKDLSMQFPKKQVDP